MPRLPQATAEAARRLAGRAMATSKRAHTTGNRKPPQARKITKPPYSSGGYSRVMKGSAASAMAWATAVPPATVKTLERKVGRDMARRLERV